MLPYYVKIEFDPDIAISKRARNEMLRAAHGAQALEWHRKFVKLHFDQPARYRYGYARRKYQRRKEVAAKQKARRVRVKMGGRRDLVYSGLTRHKMLRPPYVRAYPTRAHLTYATPSYVNTNYRPGRPQLGKELTAVTPGEIRHLEKTIEVKINRDLRDLKGRYAKRTVIIR